MHKSLKWRGEIAHSPPTPRLGREWGVVSKEEAQNLALQKRQAEDPIHNMTFRTIHQQKYKRARHGTGS